MEKRAEELLSKVKQMLKAEGKAKDSGIEDEKQLLEKYVLPAIENTKDVQRFLYSEFLPENNSLVRKLKNFVLKKIGNVTRNVTERSFMRQQKYNDNVSILLEYLFRENEDLRKQLTKLQEKIDGKK